MSEYIFSFYHDMAAVASDHCTGSMVYPKGPITRLHDGPPPNFIVLTVPRREEPVSIYLMSIFDLEPDSEASTTHHSK